MNTEKPHSARPSALRPRGCNGTFKAGGSAQANPSDRPEGKVALIAARLLSWFGSHARDLPWRREPHRDDPYAVLVSEFMLQQTQVKTVLPFWERWMRELPNVHTLAKADSEMVHRLWAGLGYYARARNLHRAAQVIMSDYAGEVPISLEELLRLPGVGRYTAGAVASIAYDQPAPILDGNVTRVLARIFNIRGDVRSKKTNATLWNLAQSLVLAAGSTDETTSHDHSRTHRPHSHLNQSLMELGALICLPRTGALCEECPVNDLCQAKALGKVAVLPRLPARPKATPRYFSALVMHKKGRVLLLQRKPGTVNANLWEFPNVEITKQGLQADALMQIQAHLKLRASSTQPLCSIKHTITRYRVTLSAFTATAKSRGGTSVGEWFAPKQIEQLPLPSAHRKIWRHVLSHSMAGASHERST